MDDSTSTPTRSIISYEMFYSRLPSNKQLIAYSIRNTILSLITCIPSFITPLILYYNGMDNPAYPTSSLQLLFNSVNYMCALYLIMFIQPRLGLQARLAIHLLVAGVLSTFLGYFATIIAGGNVWVRPITTSLFLMLISFVDKTTHPRTLFVRISALLLVLVGMFSPASAELIPVWWYLFQVLLSIASIFLMNIIYPLKSYNTIALHSLPSLISLMARHVTVLRITNILRADVYSENLVRQVKKEQREINELYPEHKGEKLPCLIEQVTKIQQLLSDLHLEKLWLGKNLEDPLRKFVKVFDAISVQLKSGQDLEQERSLTWDAQSIELVRKVRKIHEEKMSRVELLLVERFDLLAKILEQNVTKVEKNWKKGSWLAFFGIEGYNPPHKELIEIRSILNSQYNQLEYAMEDLLPSLSSARQFFEENLITDNLTPAQNLEVAHASMQFSSHVFLLVELSRTIQALCDVIISPCLCSLCTIVVSSETYESSESSSSSDIHSNAAIQSTVCIARKGLIGSYQRHADFRLAFFVIFVLHSWNYLVLVKNDLKNWRDWTKSNFFSHTGWKANYKWLKKDYFFHVNLRLVVTCLLSIYLIYAIEGTSPLPNPAGIRMPQPGVWMLFAAVLLHSPSVGATLSRAVWRILFTWVGALYAYVAIALSLYTSDIYSIGPPIIFILLTFIFIAPSLYVMSSYPKYLYASLIGATTYVIVAMSEYSVFKNSFTYCLERGVSITIGAVFASLIGLLVFPHFSGRHLRNVLPQGFDKCSETFTDLVNLLQISKTNSESGSSKDEVENLMKKIDSNNNDLRERINIEKLLILDSQYEAWEFFSRKLPPAVQTTLVKCYETISLNTSMVSLMIRGSPHFGVSNPYLVPSLSLKTPLDLPLLKDDDKQPLNQSMEEISLRDSLNLPNIEYNTPTLKKSKLNESTQITSSQGLMGNQENDLVLKERQIAYSMFVPPLYHYFIDLSLLLQKASRSLHQFIKPSKKGNKNFLNNDQDTVIQLANLNPSTSSNKSKTNVDLQSVNSLAAIRDQIKTWCDQASIEYVNLRVKLKQSEKVRYSPFHVQFFLRAEAALFTSIRLSQSWIQILDTTLNVN